MRVVLSPQFPTSRAYPAASVLDSNGVRWSIGDQLWVLRNGVRTTGHALELWSGKGFIWAKSPRTLTWWSTTDGQTWTDTGPADPETPPPKPVQQLTITGVVPVPSDFCTVKATP